MNNNNNNQALLKPIQEDFYLLDVIGGSNFTAVHPTRPVVAYNSGCMIIVYDLMTDQKVNLVHHQHEIHALAFSPPGAGNSQQGGDFLISIDFDRNEVSDSNSVSSSTMCLWNWQRGQLLQEIQIPKGNNNSTFLLQPNLQSTYNNINQLPRLLSITFEKVGGNFFVLESGSSEVSGGGYRATLWNLTRHQRVELLAQLDLELQSTCLGLSILPKSSAQPIMNQSVSHHQFQASQASTQYLYSRLRFLTLEKTCIKVWEYYQGHAELSKRIMIKQPMRQCVIADLTGFLLILGDNGKVLILDQEGEFVSSVSRENQYFTVIGTAHDKLLLGTERGTVCVYHLASLQFINEIPYQLSLLQNFQLNAQYSQLKKSLSPQKSRYGIGMRQLPGKRDGLQVNNDDSDQQFSKFKVGPPVAYVTTTSNNRFLMIKYQDGSFVVIDRTVQTPSQAIMGYQFGHFQAVGGLQWVSKSAKRGRPLVGDLGINQPDSSKVNIDTSIYKNWHQILTYTTLISNSASPQSDTFMTCSNDMSIFIWKHFGDRWSFSFIDVVKCFDQSLSYQRKMLDKSTQNLKLTAIALYPRQSLVIVGDNKGIVRVFQVSQERALFVASHQLLKGVEVNLKDDSIVEIHITQDEQYAVVAFESGLICCYDVKNSFNLIGQIEKDAQRFCYANQLQIQMKVIENAHSSLDLTSFSSYDYKNRNKDERSFTNNTFDLGVQQKPYQSQAFRVLSTTSPNSVSLRQIEVKGNKLFKTPLAQFTLDEGRVHGFDLHPSKDYLLITSTQGRIYLYRIDTGELRGTIKIPLHARGCLVDPSGLYVVVQVPPFSKKHTVNLLGPNAQDEDYQVGTHENDIERTTLLMFEIGTGMPAAELKSIFEIASMKFSDDGKYLAIGSKKGSVCVWAVGEHLHQNIKQVLDSMSYQPDFWTNYPIFLPDYGQYGVELVQSPINMMQMPVENQIDAPDAFQQQKHYMTSPLEQRPLFDQQQIPLYQKFREQQQFQQPLYQTINDRLGGNLLEDPLQLTAKSSLSRSHIQVQSPAQPQYANQGQQTNNQINQAPPRSHIAQPRPLSSSIAPQQQQYQSLNQTKIPVKNQTLSKPGAAPQHDKFYRKTFVEDQQTQVTPHQSGYIAAHYQQQQQQQKLLQQQQQQQRQQNMYATQRSAQIQTVDQQVQMKQPSHFIQRLPEVPDYANQNRQALSAQRLNMHSNQSNFTSPNKAELLYQDVYAQKMTDAQLQRSQQNPAFNLQANSSQQFNQFQPFQSQRNLGHQSSAKREPQLDYIDRTEQLNHQPIYPIQSQRQVFFEEQPNGFLDGDGGAMTYEENLDAAQLYNPFNNNINNLETGTHSNPQPAFIDQREYPVVDGGLGQSPIKLQTNTGGRLQPAALKPQQEEKQVKDPLDIDDDVSDHGSESIEQQLKQLDGMNKYMQNIRVPTRFADDNFLSLNTGGPTQNVEQAYTLERLRHEQRLMNAGYGEMINEEASSQNHEGSSTYDLVEEMYENMQNFDKKIKQMGSNHNTNNNYGSFNDQQYYEQQPRGF